MHKKQSIHMYWWVFLGLNFFFNKVQNSGLNVIDLFNYGIRNQRLFMDSVIRNPKKLVITTSTWNWTHPMWSSHYLLLQKAKDWRDLFLFENITPKTLLLGPIRHSEYFNLFCTCEYAQIIQKKWNSKKMKKN